MHPDFHDWLFNRRSRGLFSDTYYSDGSRIFRRGVQISHWLDSNSCLLVIPGHNNLQKRREEQQDYTDLIVALNREEFKLDETIPGTKIVVFTRKKTVFE